MEFSDSEVWREAYLQDARQLTMLRDDATLPRRKQSLLMILVVA